MVVTDKELTELGKQQQVLLKQVDKFPNDEGLRNRLKNLEEKLRKRRQQLIEDNSPKPDKVLDLDKVPSVMEWKTVVGEDEQDDELEEEDDFQEYEDKQVDKKKIKEEKKELKEKYKKLMEEYKEIVVKLTQNRKNRKELRKEMK